MIISLWRYSHLVLAVSSFLFLTLAAVTGLILAFEPVVNPTNTYRVNDFSQITLAQTLPILKTNYPDLIELTVEPNNVVSINGSDADGKNIHAYVNPLTGKLLGDYREKNAFFQWTTTLHRSLFLHETGRLIMGFTAFILLLITLSGLMLLIQRQRGIKRIFTRIIREDFAQYYHVVLSRWAIIPIIIIAFTGAHLSLNRFGSKEAPKVNLDVNIDDIKTQPVQKPADFTLFKNIKLSAVKSIEFPFSEDVEEYYVIKLKDRELAVNQITGDVLSQVVYPTSQQLADLSLSIHTGNINIVWAIILALASANILFFIYSGFRITWKRRATSIKNKYSAKESNFIILVGSENGSTFRFAQAIYNELDSQGKTVFMGNMNHYALFPKAEQLLVITSTYGLGEAPSNALKFKSLLEQYPQNQSVQFSVVGFGSHAYPDFCKFAFEVNHWLLHQQWAKPLVDVHTINDKSEQEFSIWAEAWSQQAGIPLSPKMVKAEPASLEAFEVMDTTSEKSVDDTFLIRFEAKRKLRAKSGDLLAIYPANDHRERLYSVGICEKQIQLSVRLHPEGLGSGFLHRLKAGETIQARVIQNKHFHFPKNATSVVMICNGTGIAPFLGMISQNKRKVPCYLYGGFRQQISLEKYAPILESSLENKGLIQFHTAFSRETALNKQYIGELIARDRDFIAQTLASKGVIMLCGSLSMQKGVIEIIDEICQSQLGNDVSFYQSRSQILMDCY
ncbi:MULTISPECIES: PepSY domain-containing protein [unclassified Arcicella]|uniref:PepSY domain-containing protein n=1 Tax=unclassified Arcicella TaxID=2644986 RepID=UPI0028607B7B|nr:MULTISPECIES: PepSY domain-containing protein [unclassified Arcicella]MDR6562202.1 sulfite reductase (NADPH) flavoprotein alpha-component [Arcicella sp. BE51]MDR6812104.1 sulfite reductase (NADPH) flavoprotein alpha-component [Arcicella sp. BE140]MDR6823415.1 sulfite reductase (NADPH) flavoprotein alpha-component [Arcicella sp. BE139]